MNRALDTLSRWILAAGAALFALSFFLPPGFDNRPFAMLRWALETAFPSEGFGQSAAFTGVAVVIAYPYAWALMVTAAALWSLRSGRPAPGAAAHVAVNAAGGLSLMAISVLMLLLDDPWLPARFAWVGAILPVAMLALIGCAARFARPERRAWAVIAVAFLPHLIFQVGLTALSAGRAGEILGFGVGGAGTVLALAGSTWLATREH
jgi:hypothetical protein